LASKDLNTLSSLPVDTINLNIIHVSKPVESFRASHEAPNTKMEKPGHKMATSTVTDVMRSPHNIRDRGGRHGGGDVMKGGMVTSWK